MKTVRAVAEFDIVKAQKIATTLLASGERYQPALQ